MNWYLDVLKNKYAEFNGRARRSEYWYFTLFNLIIAVVLGIIATVAPMISFIYIVYSIAVLVPGLAVSIRRLHDTGRSGWNLLMGLIPLVGAIILIIYMVEDSKPGENQYGANPKGL